MCLDPPVLVIFHRVVEIKSVGGGVEQLVVTVQQVRSGNDKPNHTLCSFHVADEAESDQGVQRSPELIRCTLLRAVSFDSSF